jgi:hypothetical protein
MAIVNIGAICDAVANTLSATPGLERTQSYDELTEGMNTLPTLQVYPETWETSSDSETDRISFVDAFTGIPGHRYTTITLHLDLIVRQRSQLDEDWGEAVDMADALDTMLVNSLGSCPHFGVSGIKSPPRWTATRVLFDYGLDSQGRPLVYTGFRFVLTVRVY